MTRANPTFGFVACYQQRTFSARSKNVDAIFIFVRAFDVVGNCHCHTILTVCPFATATKCAKEVNFTFALFDVDCLECIVGNLKLFAFYTFRSSLSSTPKIP